MFADAWAEPMQPLPPDGVPKNDRLGIDITRTTLRRVSTSRKSTPQHLRDLYCTGEGEVREYATDVDTNIKEMWTVPISPTGKPLSKAHLTNNVDEAGLDIELYTPAWWGQTIIGAAEFTFPRPEGWTINGKTLDKVSVKDITLAISKRQRPTSEAKYEKRMNKEHDPPKWKSVWKRFAGSILSPRDFATHFKLLQNGLNFKNHGDTRYTDKLCRFCMKSNESEIHCTSCHKLRPLWGGLAKICEEGGDEVDVTSHNFTILGLTKKGFVLRPIHSALHKIAWKFIWIEMNKETLGKGKPRPFNILHCALKRLEKQIIAHTYGIEMQRWTANGMGHELKLGAKVRGRLHPWIETDELGHEIKTSNTYKRLVKENGLHNYEDKRIYEKSVTVTVPDGNAQVQ